MGWVPNDWPMWYDPARRVCNDHPGPYGTNTFRAIGLKCKIKRDTGGNNWPRKSRITHSTIFWIIIISFRRRSHSWRWSPPFWCFVRLYLYFGAKCNRCQQMCQIVCCMNMKPNGNRAHHQKYHHGIIQFVSIAWFCCIKPNGPYELNGISATRNEWKESSDENESRKGTISTYAFGRSPSYFIILWMFIAFTGTASQRFLRMCYAISFDRKKGTTSH